MTAAPIKVHSPDTSGRPPDRRELPWRKSAGAGPDDASTVIVFSPMQTCFMGDKAVKLILDSANIPTQKRFEEA
jgi:hypothetical protein